MRTYKHLIRRLMKDQPELRDNDRLLVLAVWGDYGFYLTQAQKELFMKIPQAQIIVRRRREFRAEFPDSARVQEQRFEHYKEFKEEVVSHAVSWLNDEEE